MSEVSVDQDDNEVFDNGEQTSSERKETGGSQLTAINLDKEDEELIIDEGKSLQCNTNDTDCNDEGMKIISENENSVKLGEIAALMDEEIVDVENDVTLSNEDGIPRMEFTSGLKDLICHTEENFKNNCSDSSSSNADDRSGVLSGNDRMAVSSHDKLNSDRNNEVRVMDNTRCHRHKMLFEKDISHLNEINDKLQNFLSLQCIDCKSILGKYITVVEKPLRCFLCDFRTEVRHKLNTHLLNQHKYNEDCICSVCKFQAFDMRDLVCHVSRNHNGVKAFECKFCYFKSADRSELKNHHNLEHPRIRVHACNFCHLKSTSRGFIQDHMTKDHNDVKPYQCSFCLKRSSRKFDMLRHINYHHFNGTVPNQEPAAIEVNDDSLATKKKRVVQCNLCKLCLGTKRNLRKHIDVQHNGITLRYKKCNICDRSFSRRSQLNNHMVIEHSVPSHGMTYFYCSSCNSAFSGSQDLAKHIQLVHKEHLFYCPYCQFTSTTQDYLGKHMHVAHKDYALMCTFCDFNAKTDKELAMHIKDHSNLMYE